MVFGSSENLIISATSSVITLIKDNDIGGVLDATIIWNYDLSVSYNVLKTLS